MKYQPGDILILRNDIDTYGWFPSTAQAYYDFNPKTVTVKEIVNEDGLDKYRFEEIGLSWKENEILRPVKLHEPVVSRFEILDL